MQQIILNAIIERGLIKVGVRLQNVEPFNELVRIVLLLVLVLLLDFAGDFEDEDDDENEEDCASGYFSHRL